MTLNELGEKLGNMYHNAPRGNSVVMIHLFGIEFAKEIQSSGYSKKDIARAAEIPLSYHIEISKGVKLSNFVSVKKNAI